METKNKIMSINLSHSEATSLYYLLRYKFDNDDNGELKITRNDLKNILHQVVEGLDRFECYEDL